MLRCELNRIYGAAVPSESFRSDLLSQVAKSTYEHGFGKCEIDILLVICDFGVCSSCNFVSRLVNYLDCFLTATWVADTLWLDWRRFLEALSLLCCFVPTVFPCCECCGVLVFRVFVAFGAMVDAWPLCCTFGCEFLSQVSQWSEETDLEKKLTCFWYWTVAMGARPVALSASTP